MSPLIAIDASPELEIDDLESEFAVVIELTREIFSGDVRIEEDPDPEIAGLINIFLFATTTGDTATVMARQMEWHQRLAALPSGRDRRLRLCVEPIE